MTIGQSKVESFWEAVTNIGIGYVWGVAQNVIILNLIGLPVSVGQSAKITLIFTITSFIRQYLVRRYYNYRTVRKEKEND